MSEQRPKVSLMFDVFRVASRYESMMRAALRDYPVTATGYGILSLLRREGPHTPSAIALTMGAPKSTLTGPIHDLEKAGLVARRVDEHDRRSYVLILTDAGTALHEEMVQAMTAASDPVQAPPVDVERLRSDLARLADHLDAKLGH